ncbi:hypothetical protein FDUTEX481_07481 [Tolypothrix sp. PCC 7601]|nr:hypothetical protein FDUTEX481_07481 [Tolypothrix sp. PCC 7601]
MLPSFSMRYAIANASYNLRFTLYGKSLTEQDTADSMFIRYSN